MGIFNISLDPGGTNPKTQEGDGTGKLLGPHIPEEEAGKARDHVNLLMEA
jgi:hypothetical protein